MPKIKISVLLTLFLLSSLPLQAAPQTKSLETQPGKVGVYRIVKAVEGPYKGDLVLDLGFSNYFKFGNMNEFKEGDLVFAEPVKQSKKGLATRFNFKRVVPLRTREQIHIATEKNPLYGDDSMLNTYNAYVIRTLDGNTFEAIIDLGFGFTSRQEIRLQTESPEIPSASVPEAKKTLEEILAREQGKILLTVKALDPQGRALAKVWVNHQPVNQELLKKGLAAPAEGV